jgi:cytochrome b561
MTTTAATNGGYSRVAIGLHWIIALMIFASFGVGLYMTDIPGFTPTKLKLYSWHKWAGVSIFVIAALRVLWRLTHDAPPVTSSTPEWQRKSAHMAHVLLYILIIVIPITGYLLTSAAGIPVVYLGLWQLPSLLGENEALKALFTTVHAWLNYLMAAIVAIHAAAAIKHQYIDRDGTLARMIPFLK